MSCTCVATFLTILYWYHCHCFLQPLCCSLVLLSVPFFARCADFVGQVGNPRPGPEGSPNRPSASHAPAHALPKSSRDVILRFPLRRALEDHRRPIELDQLAHQEKARVF